VLHNSLVGCAGFIAAKSEHPGVDVRDYLGDVLGIKDEIVVTDIFRLVEVGVVDEVPVGLPAESLSFYRVSEHCTFYKGIITLASEGLDA
jgi:hypothetical protein